MTVLQCTHITQASRFDIPAVCKLGTSVQSQYMYSFEKIMNFVPLALNIIHLMSTVL